MKETGKSQASPPQRQHSAPSSAGAQVYAMTQSGDAVLSATLDLLRRFAVTHGKPVPILSQDAATFLTGRRWTLDELAQRVSHAVAANEGSLITAADLVALGG